MRKFLWEIIRPYKYYYAVMLIAPLCTGLYPITSNYAVKLLIDLFVTSNHISFQQAFVPIMWFVMSQFVLDVGWRLHNVSQLKTMPYVFQNMMHKICQHVFYLSYTYFQNNLAGSISGKIKGIGDNYYKIHRSIEFQLTRPVLGTLFPGIVLAWVNFKIFFFVLGFFAVYTPLALIFYKRLAQIEQAKQDSWYFLFGSISDRIQNILNVFSFARREKEIENIQKYYKENLNPLAIKYYKYDLAICIVFSVVYWAFIISLFLFVIYLKNAGEITVGDIAFVTFLTFLLAENSWLATMEIKSFLTDLAAFKSAFSIMEVPLCTIDKENAKKMKVSKGDILFKSVSFGYGEGSPIFDHFALHI